jgi:hypothetical protein
MSIAPAASTPHYTEPSGESVGAVPRVRHQARDAATLMAFSAVVSVGVALAFLLLALLARQA